MFEKVGVLGSPLSNCTDLKKVIIVFPESNVPPSVSEII